LFPFGWGNVTKLALAYFFSTLYFYIPVMTLYLQNKGLNYVEINSLWGIIVGTMFLTEVPTGMLADRIGRRGSINAALALQTLGEVIFIFANNYSSFVAAAVIGGLGFAFGSGSVEALVYDSLRAQKRAGEMSKAMGFIGAAQRLSNLIAFGLGGVLAVNLSQERFVLAIAITACAVAIGWMISLTLQEVQIADEKTEGESSITLLLDGARMLRDNSAFRGLVLLALATIPFRDYLMNLYQPRFVETGVPPVWLGLGLALASGLGILAARYAYWIEERLGMGMSLLLVTGLPGILYLLMAAFVHPALVVLVFCLLLGSQSLKDPIFSGHLNRHIASKNRATVLSMISMFSGVYVALMGLLIGRVADISLTYAFVFMGLIVLVGVIVFRTREPA
jgi:MFS family permease